MNLRFSSLSTRPVSAVFFGVFLLAGGLFFYFFFVRMFLKVQDARHWPATPCVIVSNEVRSHSGSKGGTTYSVDILYQYEVDGRKHQSNRYDFMGGSSSGYAVKAAIVRRFPPGATATCYVNPRDPNDAVLERRFTPVMLVGLFPLVFFFVGAGGLAWMFTGGRATAIQLNPNAEAPWLQRADWAAGRVVDSAKAKATFTWTFAAIWNAVALLVLLLIGPEALKPGQHLLAIGLILPVLGVVFILLAVRATHRWQTFGDSALELTTLPGAIGGAFEAKLCLGRPVRPASGFKFHLTCIHHYVTGSSKNSSTHDDPLWEDEQVVDAGMGDAVPVAFFIPPGNSETGGSSTNARIFWRLDVTADVLGEKYKANFEVPVFNVAQTPQQIAEAEKVRTKEAADLAHYQQPAGSRIRVQTSARGGKEFYFPAHRNPGVAAGLTAFLIPFAVAAWFTTHSHAPVVIQIIFGVVSLLLFYAVLRMWFATTRIEVDRNALTIQNNFFGLGRPRTIPVADIADIKTEIGMSSSGTTGTTVYKDIKVVCRNGKERTAVSSIRDVREAEWLATEMGKAIGRENQYFP